MSVPSPTVGILGLILFPLLRDGKIQAGLDGQNSSLWNYTCWKAFWIILMLAWLKRLRYSVFHHLTVNSLLTVMNLCCCLGNGLWSFCKVTLFLSCSGNRNLMDNLDIYNLSLYLKKCIRIYCVSNCCQAVAKVNNSIKLYYILDFGLSLLAQTSCFNWKCLNTGKKIGLDTLSVDQWKCFF